MRLTSTYEQFDTLSIHEDLLKNLKKFYELAEQIAGKPFLKTPHDVSWFDEGQKLDTDGHEIPPFFVTKSNAPYWLESPN